MNTKITEQLKKIKIALTNKHVTNQNLRLKTALDIVEKLLEDRKLKDSKNLYNFVSILKKMIDNHFDRGDKHRSLKIQTSNIVRAIDLTINSLTSTLDDESYNDISEILYEIDPRPFEDLWDEEFRGEKFPENGYKISFTQENGADLQLRMYNAHEHRWFFKYRYIEKENRHDVKFVNDISLSVNYINGTCTSCDLDMHMIFPERLDKVHIFGVDVSPNSKIFLQLIYKKIQNENESPMLKISSIQIGNKFIDCDKDTNELIKPINIPFPILDRIIMDFGKYKVPFIKNDGKETYIEFPEIYSRP